VTFFKDTSLAGNRINTGVRGGQVRLVRFFAKKVFFVKLELRVALEELVIRN